MLSGMSTLLFQWKWMVTRLFNNSRQNHTIDLCGKKPKMSSQSLFVQLNMHIWSIMWSDLVKNVVFSYNLNNKGSLLAFVGNKITLKAYLVNDVVNLVKNLVFSHTLKKDVFYWHLWLHLELLTSMEKDSFCRRFFIVEKGSLQYRQ